jgi:hypothetical protein
MTLRQLSLLEQLSMERAVEPSAVALAKKLEQTREEVKVAQRACKTSESIQAYATVLVFVSAPPSLGHGAVSDCFFSLFLLRFLYLFSGFTYRPFFFSLFIVCISVVYDYYFLTLCHRLITAATTTPDHFAYGNVAEPNPWLQGGGSCTVA